MIRSSIAQSLVITALFGVGSSALAQTQAAAPAAPSTSTAESESLLSKVGSKSSVSYFSTLVGPSLNSFTAAEELKNVPNDQGEADGTVMLDNTVKYAYKMNNTMKASIRPRFVYTPFEKGPKLAIKDTRAALSHSSLFNAGGFNLSGDVNVDLPTSASSIDAGLIMAPASTQITSYDIPSTNWNVGTYTIARGFAFTSGSAGKKLIDVYFGPYANYKISDSVQGTFLYEAAARLKGGDSITNWNSLGTDIQVGVNWDIMKQISLNPYVQLFPAGKINLSSTSVGMYISGSLL